jgi:hypothetical protein
MLKKEAERRIDNFENIDHPWIRRYNELNDSCGDDHGSNRGGAMSECNFDIFGENPQ